MKHWLTLPFQGIRVFQESGTSHRGLVYTADRDRTRQQAGERGTALTYDLQTPAQETSSLSRINLMNL